jgi:hypothetical protein
LLIGTNDLAAHRSPELTADGIRANLVLLRERLPESRILLLGLLPREQFPDAPLRWLPHVQQRIGAVRKVIAPLFTYIRAGVAEGQKGPEAASIQLA